MTDARGSTPQLIEGTVIKELKHRTKTLDFVNYRPTEFDPKSTAIEHAVSCSQCDMTAFSHCCHISTDEGMC